MGSKARKNTKYTTESTAPGGGRKRGALSDNDMDFIRANVNKIPVEQIAEAINRSEAPVKRFIKENRLDSKHEEIAKDLGKTENQILKELKDKSFYKALRDQLSIAELTMFNDQWVRFVIEWQDDVNPSEELELRELIMFEIIKNRILLEEKQTSDLSANLRKEELALSSIPHDQRESTDVRQLSEIRARIAVCSETIKDLRKSWKEMSEKSDKVRRSLYGSRSKRTENLDKMSVDITSLLRSLAEYKIRKSAAIEMNTMKATMENAQEKFYELHEYADGAVEKIILNSDSVEDEADDES